MLTKNLFASIISLAITACAPAKQPQPVYPAPVVKLAPVACDPDDTRILFGISPRPNGQYGAGFDGKAIVVYESGAWVTSQMGRIERGCLPADVVVKIRTELASAKWEVAYDEITCAAVPMYFVDYTVFGKGVYTEAMCNGQRLDADSAKVLADVTKLVTEATAK
jgi:hypothetical protein